MLYLLFDEIKSSSSGSVPYFIFNIVCINMSDASSFCLLSHEIKMYALWTKLTSIEDVLINNAD
jgi:hypothetical protein